MPDQIAQTPRTLRELAEGLGRHGDAPAIIVLQREGATQWSFAQLADHVERLARGLTGRGKQVALLAQNRAEWIVAALAVMHAGATAVPVDVQFDDEMLDHVLRDSDACCVFTDARDVERLDRLKLQRMAEIFLLDADEKDSLSASSVESRHAGGLHRDISRWSPLPLRTCYGVKLPPARSPAKLLCPKMANDQAQMTSHGSIANDLPGASRLFVIAFSVISGLLGPAHWVLADELWVGSGTGGAIQISNARILRVEAGQIFFIAAGKETSRELSKVQRLSVDGEPALNAAEAAFITSRWNDAVDGYQKTIRSTTKPWVKDWSTTRLITAAQQSGRFDAAVTAYIAILLKDPDSASNLRPQMPQAQSTYLDGAVAEVTRALSNKNLSDRQRQALLTFLMDLHRARNDAAAEQRAAEQLDEILAKDANNPEAGRAIARRKLLAAANALQARDFRAAIAEIDSARDKFLEPAQQVEALFIVAEATHGMSDAKNSTALKDAAIAYMRVVAHFKNEPAAATYVAQSLLKTGMIQEQLNEPAAAVALYQQVAQHYKDEPAADVARQNLLRLGQQSNSR